MTPSLGLVQLTAYVTIFSAVFTLWHSGLAYQALPSLCGKSTCAIAEEVISSWLVDSYAKFKNLLLSYLKRCLISPHLVGPKMGPKSRPNRVSRMENGMMQTKLQDFKKSRYPNGKSSQVCPYHQVRTCTHSS